MGSVEFAAERAECFFSANDPDTVMFVPGTVSMKLAANDAVKTLGYTAAVPSSDGQVALCGTGRET